MKRLIVALVLSSLGFQSVQAGGLEISESNIFRVCQAYGDSASQAFALNENERYSYIGSILFGYLKASNEAEEINREYLLMNKTVMSAKYYGAVQARSASQAAGRTKGFPEYLAQSMARKLRDNCLRNPDIFAANINDAYFTVVEALIGINHDR